MQETYDHTRAQFDRFRAFHHDAAAPGFTVFDTGEIICTQHWFKPGQRRHYSTNVCIVGTRDTENLPKLMTPDGEPVKPSWLSDGHSQMLVVDYDTKHVVRISWRGNNKESIPKRLHGHAYVYFPGSGQRPVSIANIRVSRPDLDKAKRAHIRELKDACRVWTELSPEASEAKRSNVWPRCAMTFEQVKDKTFFTLSNFDRVRMALYGVAPLRIVTEYTHLLLAD